MNTKKNSKWVSHKKLNLSTKGLATSRAELHQALQLVGAVGRSYSPDSEEDEFGSLLWDGKLNHLTSVAIGKEKKVIATMDLHNFSIQLMSTKYKVLFSIKCRNNTYKELAKKLRKALDKHGLDSTKLSLDLPYEIPTYPTADGKKFKGKNVRYFKEMNKLFLNAANIVSHYQRQFETASEVRCWPHHFDIATSIIFSEGDNEKKYMGIGFSPGDENYKRAYYYINLWPSPAIDLNSLPKLSYGDWNTEGWFGAVLDTKVFKKIKEGTKQHQAVVKFYKATIDKIMEFIDERKP